MLKRCFAFVAAGLAAFAARADIVINEIHSNPDVKTELVEFIELYNTGSTAVNLAGWSLSDAVEFQFPAGSSIPANGYQVITQNPTHFAAKFGKTALGPWTGTLNNEGENIVLRDAAGNIVDQVNFSLGFPWPVVGDPPGFSMELANPLFDNDLGGNWRSSGTASFSANDTVLIPRGSDWKYFKGTQEPSTTTGAWRDATFNDGGWLSGRMPIGYGNDIPMNTVLSDMQGSYSIVYFRKTFNVADPSQFAALTANVVYDDGFKLWINGQLLIFPGMPSSEVPYNGLATGTTREDPNYFNFNLPIPLSYLHAGQNVIAVQGANIALSSSSDFFVDLDLIGKASAAGTTPTPFARNNSFTNNLPPAIRQVDHSPNQPSAGQAVTITAKVTDPEGVASVQLQYQVVEPGNYIELTDSAYPTSWTSVVMKDDGTGGDQFAGDSVYTVTLPGTLQTHRRLIRYRITAADATGKSITAPYADDPVPNFAYFCYNGVPAYSAAIAPGNANQALAQVVTYPSDLMSKLPVYQLISKKSSVTTSTWTEKYGGDLYKWSGTLVYNGKVYDHIHYRSRGGVWRYAMGKNMWKFDFNRGHDFHPRDNWGHEYDTPWTKLNLGACIQQGDYNHRGEQGMFESVGFRLFNLAGLEAPKSHFIQFRVVDDANENGTSQYTTDFWGLYLAVEQEDGRFLEEHKMPDANFYKMEGGTGTLNNQGLIDVTDKSDLNSFLSALTTTQPESWWRANFDVDRYYSYRTIVEGIHHYDIDGDPGKNYFYYTNDVSHKWEVHAWDLDLTWADTMYGGGNEQFKSRVLPIPNLSREYKNRVRELRDLLYNTEQTYKLIDEYAAMIYTTNGLSFVAADRAMWDYNPVMTNTSLTVASKAGAGRFYQIVPTKDFPGMVKKMKDYVVTRGSILDSQAADAGLPNRPTIANLSPANNPANKLSFQSSAYSGGTAFAAMQWRLGEITPASAPAYDPNSPRVYEIEPVWQSAELTTFNNTIAVPSGVVKVGHTYRARVKMKDAVGRWSNWSTPVEFVAGEPDNATALVQNLRLSELMYNPPLGNDYEFIELWNTSSNLTLDLSGIKFTAGIDFTFPTNSLLAPHRFCVIHRAPNVATFKAYYNIADTVPLFGPYTGSLSNDGEELTLKTTAAGTTIVSFVYGDNGSWPVAADGAGHSLVPLFDQAPQNTGDFSAPGNWRASAFLKGSPGSEDRQLLAGPVVNEIMANTDFSDPAFPGYDSNDWIEIANLGASSFSWANCYLSDDPANLKKWPIPAGSIAPGALVTFDETTGFHSPITSGFGLDQAGEKVFLSYLPGNSLDRVIDAVKFKGQSPATSWMRTTNGFWRPGTPTRGAANAPAPQSLVISEIMYHPPPSASQPTDNTSDEYVEIYNPTASTISLFDNFGAWRIDGGINFQFPANTTLASQATLLLVNFNPTTVASSNAFRAKYNLPAGVKMLGPYSGKLGNDSDRIAIERPEPPETIGDPYAWVVIDEVTYGNRPLWPLDADGSGASLHRISVSATGNDPASWQSAAPDPGSVLGPNDDLDNDGMADAWELAHGLNPNDPSDASADADNDGISSLAEYQLGTDPRDASSGLTVNFPRIESGFLLVRMYAVAGKTYLLERCDDLTTHQWNPIQTIGPTAGSQWTDVTDTEPSIKGSRFYRLKLQP